MALLLSLLAGIAGAALGWVAAAALTMALGGLFGIPDFEGGRGMLPGQLDRIFKLNLPASPRRTTQMTGWQKADFIAEPGLSQSRKTGPDEGFEIRRRVHWTG